MAATPEQIQYQLAHRHEDRSGAIIGAITTVTVLATIAVLLRFMSRRVIQAKIMADDYFTVAALIFSYAMLATQAVEIHNGLAKHIATLTPQQIITFSKALWCSELIYVTSLFLIKCSMLFLYRRVFGNINRAFSIALYTVGFSNVCCWIIVFFIFACQCTPIAFAWDKTIPGGHCIAFNTLCVSTAAISIATDVVILTLPGPMIWSLQLSRLQKLAIIGVFSLGGFVCISSIIRIPALFKLDFSDPTYTDYGAATWSNVEMNMAIVSACLPSLRPLFAGNREHRVRKWSNAASYRLNFIKDSFRTQSDEIKSSESEEKIVELKTAAAGAERVEVAIQELKSV